MSQRTKTVEKAIADWLSETLDASAPGDRLPTVRELMRRFATAQRTIEKVLQPYIESGRLQARRGLGIVVSPLDENGRPNAHEHEGDLLVLYRISNSPLARDVVSEMEARLSLKNYTILQIAYSNEQQALSVLRKMGHFRTCLLQVHFESLTIEFLAALHQHVDNIVIDGVSVTGINADGIGTNWREALSVAFRKLQAKGHQKIAFLTSANNARQIAMARREFGLLSESLPDPDTSWLIEIDKLPGNYTAQDIVTALNSVSNPDSSLPFTVLIVWGIVEGYVLENALSGFHTEAADKPSVVLLGSVDVASEHLHRFDVVGNSNAEKLSVLESLLVGRIEQIEHEPATHYLPIHSIDNGSIKSIVEQ